MIDPTPERRRPFQFIRNLREKLAQTRREQDSVFELESVGADITYSRPKVVPYWVNQPFRRVHGARFLGSSVTDTELEYLQELTRLEVLNLSYTQVTDEGLKYLSGLTNLWSLELNETAIGDEGLKYLRGLSKLARLHLTKTRVTDAGLAYLRGLPRLGLLEISDVQVTDAGLVHLEGLTNLGTLNLTPTKINEELCGEFESRITDAGVEKLRQALPECAIHFQPLRMM